MTGGEPTLSPAEVERIAAGLTKAQRALLCSAPREVSGTVFFEHQGARWRSTKALRVAGLSRNISRTWDEITPLGLLVRAHLLTKDNPNG